ncbi:branched-chain amino acid ABC transporter permease [Candidatus Peribacteria bacterium]|nr:branched-chain amino acid ABC transporter permease [Candidatus Peribacteria bacterium]
MLEYLLSLAILMTIWSLLTQSYNLSFGLTGLFNLGHIIFYGMGAYTAAILSTQFGSPFLLNLLLGALIAGAFAAVLGLLTLRLSGHYLAIATLGAAMIAIVVATNWISLTNGPMGIRGISQPSILGVEFSSSWAVLALYLVIVIACQWVLWRLFRSPFGRLQRAIAHDEIAAKGLGKDTFRSQVWSLTLSAAFAAVAGGLYAHYRLFLDPSIFALPEIIFLLLMLIVGGQGSFSGAIGGTVIVLLLGEVPRFVGFPDALIGPARNLLYAALLISCMFFAPRGVVWLFTRRRASI